MTGPWKEWKTKPRFPTLPTVPWKSGQPRQISTFPPPRLAPHGKVENQTQVFHFPTQRKRRRLLFSSPQKSKKQERKSAAMRPPHPDLFQDHLVLESNPVSGSSLDWKMLSPLRYNHVARALLRAVSPLMATLAPQVPPQLTPPRPPCHH